MPNSQRDSHKDLIERRRSSFGAAARAYAEHRPGYPREAVRWALERAAATRPGGEGRTAKGALDVLDLGAGTGKLTAVVAALGHRVTAVEPDAEMIAELRRLYPDVTTRQGDAERIPLPDASVDAVVVGQAFHWFDQDRALPEITRVLRPGGVVAGLWNADDDRVEWVRGLVAVSPAEVSTVSWGDGPGVGAHPLLGRLEVELFTHRVRHTVDSLLAVIGTHSHQLTLEPAALAEESARIRAYLEGCPETASGPFDLPLTTRVEVRIRTGNFTGS
ncbi:class I SAM-dependent methyltransferase [Actinacidiphila yeochonensis]|uniref:class I SAM-dependent methyltransferase n=1 Tax=Actinacidiphila yeochonensis TaxID=89050 RepID=UPI00068DEC99|nr:class I SAM-dependent methyltransferase [Actinacidiphila yeochonensis]